MRITSRRCVLGVAGAAGAALLFASAAYACTNFRGTMTVTAGSGSTKVVGSGLGMSYCAGYPKDNAAAPAGGAHGTSGGTIKISVAPSTGCNTLRLAADTYHANFANGKAYTFTVNATTHKRTYSGIKIDCMNLGRGISSLTPATLSVPATGVASANFKLPGGLLKSGPSDAAAVCLANTGATIGLQAPIIIV